MLAVVCKQWGHSNLCLGFLRCLGLSVLVVVVVSDVALPCCLSWLCAVVVALLYPPWDNPYGFHRMADGFHGLADGFHGLSVLYPPQVIPYGIHGMEGGG